MRIAIVALLLTLSGCALVTVSDLDAGKGSSYEVVVESPSPVVYKRVVERMRQCLQVADLRVDADYFPDGAGRATLVATKAYGLVLATTKIEPQGAHTLVRVSWHDPWKTKKSDVAMAVGEWANGRPGECMADEMKPRPRADPSRPG